MNELPHPNLTEPAYSPKIYEQYRGIITEPHLKSNIRIVIASLIVLIIGASSFYVGSILMQPKPKEIRQVTLAMSWILTGEHSAFYAAVEEGFYREEGLAVNLQRGFGSGDTVRRVALGESMFGQGAVTSLIQGVAAGQKVKMIAMTVPRNPMVVVFLSTSGINTLKDLEGRKMGETIVAAPDQFFPAFCKINKIDCNKVQKVAVPNTAKATTLLSGQVDFTTAFFGSLSDYNKAAASSGKQLTVWPFADYGMPDLYGSGLFTTDDLIKKDSDLVERFVRATVRAHTWSLKNPDKAIAYFLKYSSQETPAAAKESFEFGFRALALDGISEKEGIGVMNPQKMAGTVNLCNDYLPDLKRKVNVDEVYTNQFVEKIPREWRFMNLTGQTLPVANLLTRFRFLLPEINW